jgi:membrane fusion protein (multidrug efflux system)
MAAAVYFGLFAKPPSGTPGETGGRQVAPVTVTSVEPSRFVDIIEAVGTGKAKESIDLTAKAAETIGALNFTDGQKVEAGYVVAELTSREQSADLAGARADLSVQTQNYDRVKGLHEKGFASQAQLDAATAQRDSAAARVHSLESRVADRLIKAPFAGVLGLRRVSVGALVKPGDVIATLDDISLIKVEFSVPEGFLSALQTGMDVRVAVEAYPGRSFEGKVAGIDTRIDPVSRAVALRAEIPNPESLLRPGMLMSVSVLRNPRVALAVPEQSLVPMDERQFVYIVGADGKAERREVKIGARVPGRVEIVAGLRRGERVVVDGTIRMRPGIAVKIVGDKSGGAPKPGGAGS